MESASLRLKPPRKKKRVYMSKEPPFPVPIESITSSSAAPASSSNWQYYTGTLCDRAVIVKHSGDMDMLFRMGFFGKGCLSRSQPEYNHGFAGIQRGREHTGLRLMAKRRYLTHLHWSRTSTKNHEGSIEAKEKFEFEKLPLKTIPKANTEHEVLGKNAVIGQTSAAEIYGMAAKNALAAKDAGTGGLEDSANQEQDPWGVGYAKKSEEVWGTTEVVEEDPWKMCTTKESEDFWGNDNENDNKTLETSDIKERSVHEEDERTLSELEGDVVMSNANRTESVNVSSNKEANQDVHMLDKGSLPGEHIPDTVPQADSYENKSVNETTHASDEKVKPPDPDLNLERDLDTLCESDEEDGELYVVEDSDYSEGEELAEKSKTKWLPVVKRDPAPIKEFLQLALEEAFFLSYGLGCLIVKDEKENVLDLLALWRRCCDADSAFVEKYIVYHHLRSKGWVPKAGLKYGAHYVVYKEGPAFYHSSYSVIIRTARADLHDDDANTLSWQVLSGLNRVTETVNKEVMICYVVKPADMKSEDLQSPNCITKFKVQELVVRRWISNQERENIQFVTVP